MIAWYTLIFPVGIAIMVAVTIVRVWLANHSHDNSSLKELKKWAKL